MSARRGSPAGGNRISDRGPRRAVNPTAARARGPTEQQTVQRVGQFFFIFVLTRAYFFRSEVRQRIRIYTSMQVHSVYFIVIDYF